MNGNIERLAHLGFVIDSELSVGLLLAGLSDSSAMFVLSHNMNVITSTVPELINKPKMFEFFFEKRGRVWPWSTREVLPRRRSKRSSHKGTCFKCRKDGHRKRNCKACLESIESPWRKVSNARMVHGVRVVA